MSLLEEIHNQSHSVRKALWLLSTFIVVSFIGFFWLNALQRSMFIAMHSDPAEQAAFLAKQDARSPKPFAFIGRGFNSLTASIGGMLGLDQSAGFDRINAKSKVYLLPLSK
jgi:hypothetical protein